jgi:PAS domain S-box-containing protein
MSKKMKSNCIEETAVLTERIKELEQQQTMFQGLLATVPDNIYFKDTKSRFVVVSDYMKQKVFRNLREEYIGKTDFDYFTKEHAQPAYDDEQKIIKTGKPLINFEEKETFEDGYETWVSTTKVPLRDKYDKIVGICGISRDITAEKKLKEAQTRYRENLELAKNETDNILKNVEEGLFLINKEYVIASQYSSILETILGEKEIANKNLVSVLNKKIDKETLELLNDYLEMLFDKNLVFEMVHGLNPLVEIKTNIKGKTKYLTFNFKRILDSEGKIDQLIATVNDVTREIELAQSLEEEKAESKRSLEWLLLILNVEPSLLEEFVDSYKEELYNIRYACEYLKSGNHEELLNAFARSVHSLKGNASLLEISFLVSILHSVEDFLQPLKLKSKLNDSEINLVEENAEYIGKMYEELLKLIDQIKGINQKLNSTKRYDGTVFLKSLERLTRAMSYEYNKQVELDYSGFKVALIPEHHRLLVRDILVQMVRNSICHGIEDVSERVQSGKTEIGHLKVSGYEENNEYIMIFEDDGQGIRSEKLARHLTLAGKRTEEEVSGLNESELYNSIFLPGVSTAENMDVHAGRGVGMDIIKKKIEKIEGKILLATEPGKYTRFVVSIPYKQAS